MSQVAIDIKQDPEVLDMLARAHRNTAFYCKWLLHDQFYAAITDVHKQVFDLIDSGARKIAIAAPRGIGKTTIARAVATKGLTYRDVSFVPYIMNSATVAEMQTENLKRDLLYNQTVRKFFGNIKVSDVPKEMEEMFSKMAWVAYGSTLILPRGQGQQIRGLNWHNKRPDLIIIDDLENKDEVKNPDNRTKLRDWFFGDVMKSVSQYDKDWRVIYIDTLKHEDSLLQLLLDASDWESLELAICDENLNSLIPDYMTTEELKAEYKEHEEKGILDVFYMERMNSVIGEHNPFKPPFKTYSEHEIKSKNIENIVIYDPAKTVTPNASETGIVAVGIDNDFQRYLVRDALGEKLMPDEQYNEVFAMAARWKATAVGIEVTGLNEFILQPFKNEMMRRGATFSLVELKPRGGRQEQNKDERIKQLSPYFRRDEIWLNEAIAHLITAQLIPFPRSKRKDLVDALAYLLQMLEIGNRYFLPPDPPGDDPEAEFKELENEYLEPVVGWEII